ncbi:MULTISPECIES: LapA family protein [Pseudomonas]|uniref:LapA family protein n=1 Tax=Pseudomonas TaxID=286 RepID=UPI00235FA16D|nr:MULTISPECIES: LapA family protein [Pseudomonas]WJV24863.1 LapA family protein [Pseudomonas chlororaphis]
MRNLKKLLLVLIVLVIVAVVLLFVLENQQNVVLVFLGWAGPQLPVSMLVLAAFLVGLAIGPVLAAVTVSRRRRLSIGRAL